MSAGVNYIVPVLVRGQESDGPSFYGQRTHRSSRFGCCRIASRARATYAAFFLRVCERIERRRGGILKFSKILGFVLSPGLLYHVTAVWDTSHQSVMWCTTFDVLFFSRTRGDLHRPGSNTLHGTRLVPPLSCESTKTSSVWNSHKTHFLHLPHVRVRGGGGGILRDY